MSGECSAISLFIEAPCLPAVSLEKFYFLFLPLSDPEVVRGHPWETYSQVPDLSAVWPTEGTESFGIEHSHFSTAFSCSFSLLWSSGSLSTLCCQLTKAV